MKKAKTKARIQALADIKEDNYGRCDIPKEKLILMGCALPSMIVPINTLFL